MCRQRRNRSRKCARSVEIRGGSRLVSWTLPGNGICKILTDGIPRNPGSRYIEVKVRNLAILMSPSVKIRTYYSVIQHNTVHNSSFVLSLSVCLPMIDFESKQNSVGRSRALPEILRLSILSVSVSVCQCVSHSKKENLHFWRNIPLLADIWPAKCRKLY